MVHRQQVLQGRGGGGGEGGSRRGGGVGGHYHPLQSNKGSVRVCRVNETLTEKDVCTSLYIFSSQYPYRRPTRYGRCSEPKPHPLWV